MLAASTCGSRAARVFALLGPNGAGKTTIVRILATLIARRTPAGRASPASTWSPTAGAVRRSISLTGQYAAVDELQTGEENLRMMARLAGLTGRGRPRARRASCSRAST